MADGITKDDLRDILIEVRREDMGHNNYYNVPPGGEVTKAINNKALATSRSVHLNSFVSLFKNVNFTWVNFTAYTCNKQVFWCHVVRTF